MSSPVRSETSTTGAGPFEPTIEASPAMLLEFPQAEYRPQPTASRSWKVDLVQESDGDTQESLRLLHTRLTAVTLALAVGFVVFAIWLTIRQWSGNSTESWLWLLAEYLVTVILLGTGAWLYRTRSISAECARSIELIVFAIPAIFFAGHVGRLLIQGVNETGQIGLISIAGWPILIFAHAIFIPNSWRRAAIVSVLISAMPVLTTLAVGAVHQKVRQVLWANPTPLIDLVLTLLATVIVALAGVRTIHRLRTEMSEVRQLGRYRLRRRIGSGGMGEVFLAEHHLLKRPVALKVIHKDKAGDEKTMARFEREVQATAKLNHWNSIQIYDYGNTADGMLYYVMEYLPGMTLQELVNKSGPLPPGRAIYLLRQVCAALHEAHDLGLIHRDIKPANIFVSERGGQYDVAKLLDFGLVKPLQTPLGDSDDLTQEGNIAGSPLYMSPEQVLAEVDPDTRSDIYSLGAVAFFMLTGKPPFQSGATMRILLQHLSETPPPMNSMLTPSTAWKIPNDLESTVLKCMAKDLEMRYAQVRQFESALAACSSASEWNAEKAERWWKDRCPRLRSLSIEGASQPECSF